MRQTAAAVLVLVLFLPSALQAQEALDPRVIAAAAGVAAAVMADDAVDERWAWKPERRRLAGFLSDGLVAGSVVSPCAIDRTWRCVRRLDVSAGLAYTAAELTKRFVKRERPDKSDQKSFFSMHTAIACAAAFRLENQAVGAALCGGTGYLRIAAHKHWLTDTLVGAAVGFGMSRIGRE